MGDLADDQFEVVGDPDDLPDALFDALAALLLAVADQNDAAEGQCREYTEEETRS